MTGTPKPTAYQGTIQLDDSRSVMAVQDLQFPGKTYFQFQTGMHRESICLTNDDILAMVQLHQDLSALLGAP